MGAAVWSWFLVGSEGNVRHWSLLARCRFRPSVPWCFAVSESPAGRSLWSCFEGMGAALWSWFLVGSEGNVRHWSLLARRRFRPSVPWWFAVSESLARTSLWSCFGGMGAALWSWFLVGSEGNVKQWSLLARRRFRPSVPWCFALSESPARTSLWGCRQTDRQTDIETQTDRHRQTDRQTGFLVGSEGNVRHWSLLARRRFRPSVPWCFAVSESPARTSLLFRNRPLELRCGAVLRAWELQFGAGFLSVQKALDTGACLLGAASVLLCHGVLLFRNRPLGGRCGAVLRAWELHFGAGFLSVQRQR